MKLPIAIISTMRSGSTALLWEYYERLTPNTDSITILNEPKSVKVENYYQIYTE